MSMFGEIKCGRCDRRYSAARAKCPYCGARKGRSGRRVDTTDSNGRAKVVVGLILLLLIIVAVAIVVAGGSVAHAVVRLRKMFPKLIHNKSNGKP